MDEIQMAQRKDRTHNGPGLFDEQERELERRIRRQRAALHPALVREAAESVQLRGEAQDRAHEIVLRWADLETSGRLPEYKETSVDTQFLDQIFGEGLGYQVKTTSPDAWQLEHKYFVKEVGTADAALGDFPKSANPTVMVELKGSLTDLDRDRSNGRTAVQQCWDYLNAVPGCPWGIVSNFKTIRLYHREKGTLAYEEFTLQELRKRDRFNDFYCLFQRDGLIPSRLGQSRAHGRTAQEDAKTDKRWSATNFIKSTSGGGCELIEHLIIDEERSFDDAIRIAQKLLDRIIFIAFCEDRDLLPEKSLEATRTDIRTYSRAKNPAWENFLDLFTAIDKGAKGKREITAFNGGLFADDRQSTPWNWQARNGPMPSSASATTISLRKSTSKCLGTCSSVRLPNWKSCVSEVFRRSSPISKAKMATGSAEPATGRRKSARADSPVSKMPKSAQRKRFGIYYTPPAFTGLIVERTVDAVVKERFARLGRNARGRSGSPSGSRTEKNAGLLASLP